MEKPQEGNQFPVILLAGAVVVLLVAGASYLLLHYTQGAAPGAERLPLGPDERTYAERIHFNDVQMSRAANFLNQEITFLSGVISNDGTRTIRDMEVRVEYRDSLNQVVLRETMHPLRALGSRPEPLPAGRSRRFQFGFEHIPEDWNRQYPEVRVTGLLLE